MGSHCLMPHIVKRPDFLVMHRASNKIWKFWTNIRIISKIHLYKTFFMFMYHIMGKNSVFLNDNRDLDNFFDVKLNRDAIT